MMLALLLAGKPGKLSPQFADEEPSVMPTLAFIVNNEAANGRTFSKLITAMIKNIKLPLYNVRRFEVRFYVRYTLAVNYEMIVK